MAVKQADNPNSIKVYDDGVTPVGEQIARLQTSGVVGNAITARNMSNPLFGDAHQPSVEDMTKATAEIVGRAKSGDMGDLTVVLASQVVALNATFSGLMNKAAQNMGQHLDATDRYLRLAMKAQAQCRATAEALAKMHQPREQTVRHVHVYEGGQAVVAEQFHAHAGGSTGANFADQPRAIDAPCPSVPRQDALGQAMPVASGAGE